MVGSTYIAQYRAATTALLAALDTLTTLRQQFVALDLGNTLTEGDFSEGHQDLTKAQFVAALTSVAALTAFTVDNFHVGNLYRLKP